MANRFLRLSRSKPFLTFVRFQSIEDTLCDDINDRKGLVIGLYEGCKTGEYKFTSLGAKFDEQMGGRLSDLIKGSDTMLLGKTRLFHNMGHEFYAIAVSGLGQEGLGYNENETLDECRENVRIAAGIGAQALNRNGVGKIFVEGFNNTEAAAEGSILGLWRYQEFKNKDDRKLESSIELYEDPDGGNWSSGVIKAESQNTARTLEETPGNLMTPMNFAQAAIQILCPCGIQVDIRDRDWIIEKGMTAFLALARGSCDSPLFLEVSYCGGSEEDKPVILVGKGVTFESGGLSLNPCRCMSELKADMAGAAVVIGVMKSMAQLGLPINVTGLIPLMENMPGGMAMKPGDVVAGLGKKTIRIEDMSNEGRIILSDALAYSNLYKPCLVISIATSTYGIREALGSSASGAFTTSEVVWKQMRKAGAVTGDRVWRMPLWKHFTERVANWESFDVDNVGRGYGSPSKQAAFLKEFAPLVDYMHLDIFGTGMRSSGTPLYLRKNHMTGRPTRTVIQFLNQMACPLDKTSEC